MGYDYKTQQKYRSKLLEISIRYAEKDKEIAEAIIQYCELTGMTRGGLAKQAIRNFLIEKGYDI